jgi:hypothetical protein
MIDAQCIFFSSCRLLFRARLPLSQPYGGRGVALFENVQRDLDAVQQQIMKTEGKIAALDFVENAGGLSQKQERQLREEKRQLREEKRQLREEKLVLLQAKAAGTGARARGHVVCVCVSSLLSKLLSSVFQSTPCSFFSPSVTVFSQQQQQQQQQQQNGEVMFNNTDI